MTLRDGRPGPARSGTSAVVTTVVSVMPVFLVGGLSVQISRELGLGAADLGIAVAVYFGVTAFSSVPVGRLVERFGAAVTARLGILLAAGAMAAIATFAHSYPALLGLLAIAAAANSLGQLSSNALLGQGVGVRRQGLAFGVKQAAIPFATLLASASVPAVALTVGWRWAFVAGSVVALLAVPVVPGDRAAGPASRRTGPGGRAGGLVLLAIGAALAAAAANSVSAFVVESAVAAGHSESGAGVILTIGSAVCVACRVLLGALPNRWRGRQLPIVGVTLAASAGGIGLLGIHLPDATLLGVCIGYGVGWSFPGLLNYAVVRLHPHAPAAATSVTQTGIYAGSCLGPLGFGLLVTRLGFPWAWAAAAESMGVAGFFIIAGYLVAKRRTPAWLAPTPAVPLRPVPYLPTVGRPVSTVPYLPFKPPRQLAAGYPPNLADNSPTVPLRHRVSLAATGIDPAITGEPPEEQATVRLDRYVLRRQPQ